MKALVTAGGRGTRLRPITHTQNKHLIPIANKPILFYALENIRDAGIRNVGIIVSPADRRELEQAITNERSLGLEMTYIEQDSPRGLADCVRIAQPFIGDEPFVFYLGDNMIVGGITRFIHKFHSTGANCFLTLARVTHPERFGVPELNCGKIVRIIEKPINPLSPYAVAGIYIYDAHIFDAVNGLAPSARGEFEISDAHQYMIDKGLNVCFDEITGWWKDTGTPEDLLEANRFVLEHISPHTSGVIMDSTFNGNLVFGTNTVIRNSSFSGPIIIGDGCVIENAKIGPFTSIGANSRIEGCTLENSIVFDRCLIRNIARPIASSIIGFDTEIVQGEGAVPAHRFMIGDQSHLEIA